MQHFQSILIIIGLLAIGGVLIHGYLLSRKEKKQFEEQMAESERLSSNSESLNDDDIISDVRIIGNDDEADKPVIDFSKSINDDPIEAVDFNDSNFDPLPISDNAMVAGQNNEFEIIDLEKEAEHFDIHTDSDTKTAVAEDAKETKETISEQPEIEQPQDLFIFNVVAKEDAVLGGHEILQFFLTSGFRFGEMSIFHRHENSDGTGPILFSIANMMAPGIFDPDTMEQFKSEGVSFFLTAPNKNINVRTSFEMMLRAVEQMAEEFDCVVLNADREPMTEAQFIEYNHRLLHHI